MTRMQSLLRTLVFCAGFLISAIRSTSPPPPVDHIFSNPPDPSAYQIPSRHDSAILARRMLDLSSIGTLSTVFQSLHTHEHPRNNPVLRSSEDTEYEETLGAVPTNLDLSGVPIGLMDYYAACGPQTYSPTILAIDIATTFRNAHGGSNISLSLRWHPPPDAPPSDDVYTYSPANMPRFSLIGDIEPILPDEIERFKVEKCFLDKHPDAEAWLPGNEIHRSWWGRFIVRGLYWIGGFGDRAYIGWISAEEWQNVTEKEIEKTRLVGEHGYQKYKTHVATESMGDL